MDSSEFGADHDFRVLSREDLENEVRQRTFELQNVMDTMADILVKIDDEGRIEMANAAVSEILGYDSVEGKPLDYLFASPDDNEELTELMTRGEILERLLSSGNITDIEVLFETVDGDVVPMSLSASVMEEGGRISGVVCVAKDISEIKRREREVRLLNEVLRRVLRHNMRNKLGIVQGAAETIPEADEPTQERLSRTIVENSKDLMETGEKARTIAQVIYEFDDRVELDLKSVVKRVVDRASDQYDDAAIRLETSLTDAPAVCHEGLPEAIENLVENGVVHNNQDEPQVTVRLERTANDETCISVVDNGPGIHPDEIAVLQQREETSLEHGSGAGLWLVSWIARRSSADLTFDRESGQTIVSLYLPRT